VRITGEHSLPAPPTEVWAALHDVSILRAAVPGCNDLEQTGPATYAGSARIGIAIIKGLYRGTVSLSEEQPFDSLCVEVDAGSGHGRIAGQGSLTLEPSAGGTIVRYTGDVHVHGPLAAVGQRLLPSATKSLTGQFFQNFERALGERTAGAHRGGS
jgi:carbon monoxide dehydrogenase subunit G